MSNGTVIFIILSIETMLFSVGFFYGLLYGNKNMIWFVRSISGAIFFLLFYIAIPALFIAEYYSDKKNNENK